MLHYIQGKIRSFGDKKLIIGTGQGIQVHYQGTIKDGSTSEFFCYPYLDDNHKTIQYFAFDTFGQKEMFESLLKISGIGPKTAFHISAMDQHILKQAIKEFDIKTIQKLPGVGPKTAKRILVELKHTVTEKDVSKLTIDDKLLKDIVKTLKPLGYETTAIKSALECCEITLDKKNLSEIIKWVIGNI